MNGVGGTSNQQQVQDLQQRHLSETQQAEVLEQVGSGHASTQNLSVGHEAAATNISAGKVALAPIPMPGEGALQAVNMMDTSDLQATIAGLRGETDEVQAELQLEAIEQNQARRDTANSERLEQLGSELQQVEDGNKCAQQTAKICMCIPGVNLVVGLPAMAAAKAGDNKADAIRAEMMELKFGPEVGGQMAQFMEDYEKTAEQEAFLPGMVNLNRGKLHEQLDQLHQAGVIDDVAHFEINQMLDSNTLKDAGKFGKSSALEQRLTDLAMGVKGATLPPDAYPPGMLEANGYTADGQDASVNETPDGAGSVPGGVAAESTDAMSAEWLAHLAQQMQEAEEQDQALSQLQQDIQDAQTAVFQSNNGAQQQQGVQQRMI